MGFACLQISVVYAKIGALKGACESERFELNQGGAQIKHSVCSLLSS